MAAKRILIVDDDPEVVSLLGELFEGHGYEVGSAGTAAAALERIRDEIYDVAILDFDLPDMNGIMLHRQIRQIDEELSQRTLFASGLMQSQDNLGYYSSQGQGFLTKPFDLDEVVAAVRQVTGD